MSYRSTVDLDEREAYPDQPIEILDRWGLQHFYVPVAEGGRLRSLEELMALVRVVARRNLTVAVCHSKTFLGAVNVWVAGTADQRRRVAEAVLRGELAALAYHERDHGSDLLATDTFAEPDGDGYRLTGEKWLVNNATRGELLTVLARTDATGGPRGYSLFLVEKSRTIGGYTHLSRIRTTGIRGADFSGVRFDGCRLPADALIGTLGSALDVSLRSFQVTRALLPALSLGAADAGLRAVVEFALARRLYGRSITALAPVRATLAGALATLLFCEALAVTALRTLHFAPEYGRMLTAVSKFFVPKAVDASLRELAAVLGARHYLREEHLDGIFQKVLRDHAVVRVFHGGPFQLLQTVGLGLLSTGRRPAALPAQVFSWHEPVPAVRFDRLVASGGAAADAMGDLTSVLTELADSGTAEAPPELVTAIHDLIRVADRDRSAVREGLRNSASYTQSVEFQDVCERAVAVTAAACAVRTWWTARPTWEPELASGEWLALALHHILRQYDDGRRTFPATVHDRVAELLFRLHRESRQYSLAMGRDGTARR